MARKPLHFELSVRRQAEGGEVADNVSKGDELLRSGSRHILILVHGYNNSQSCAKTRFETFRKKFLEKIGEGRGRPDAIADFHWPGDVSTWLGTTVGYPFDIKNARRAAQLLADLLARLPDYGPPSVRITFIGHSMGCRLILEALARLPDLSPGEAGFAGLMAPAVPVKLVQRKARLFRTGQHPRSVMKFFSEADWVLQFGFPLGQWLAYQWQIEDDNYAEAVGRFGKPDEYGEASATRNDHGAYWTDSTLVGIVVRRLDATTPRELPISSLPTRTLLAENALLDRDLPSRTAPFSDT
jgi:esterase/lipase superfamily enzyme